MEWLNLTINIGVFIIVVITGYLLVYFSQEWQRGIKIYGTKWLVFPYYLILKELTRNCYVGGSTGAGKTVVLNHVLDGALEKGLKIFILDIKGDYEKAIGDKSLVISHEHQLIDFFYDLATPQKSLYIDEIANFIFPQAEKGEFFDTSAYQLFKHFIQDQKIMSFQDFLTGMKKEGILEDTYKKYANVKEVGNSARDIISTFSLRLDKYMQLMQTSKLTSLQSVLASKQQVVILRSIPNLHNVYATFNTIYFMLLMNEVLTMSDSRDDKFLFLLDEAGTLRTLSFVDNFVSLCRSKGAGCVIASQSLSQLGEHKENILNNCNYKIIGRLNDLGDIRYFDELFVKLGKEGKKYNNVGTLPDLHFYQVCHLEKEKIRKTKVNYFKL